jgi:hypothetical protein
MQKNLSKFQTRRTLYWKRSDIEIVPESLELNPCHIEPHGVIYDALTTIQ